MAETKENTIQVAEKEELSPSLEQTKPGPVFVPAADIFETEKALVLLADLPGVSQENLDIDLRENVLTISGAVPEDENGSELLKEYHIGRYFRQFTLSEVIDQEGIDATLKNGVLRLTLPKTEKARPRKISVSSS